MYGPGAALCLSLPVFPAAAEELIFEQITGSERVVYRDTIVRDNDEHRKVQLLSPTVDLGM